MRATTRRLVDSSCRFKRARVARQTSADLDSGLCPDDTILLFFPVTGQKERLHDMGINKDIHIAIIGAGKCAVPEAAGGWGSNSPCPRVHHILYLPRYPLGSGGGCRQLTGLQAWAAWPPPWRWPRRASRTSRSTRQPRILASWVRESSWPRTWPVSWTGWACGSPSRRTPPRWRAQASGVSCTPPPPTPQTPRARGHDAGTSSRG